MNTKLFLPSNSTQAQTQLFSNILRRKKRLCFEIAASNMPKTESDYS
jgi:hypothetical protein